MGDGYIDGFVLLPTVFCGFIGLIGPGDDRPTVTGQELTDLLL